MQCNLPPCKDILKHIGMITLPQNCKFLTYTLTANPCSRSTKKKLHPKNCCLLTYTFKVSTCSKSTTHTTNPVSKQLFKQKIKTLNSHELYKLLLNLKLLNLLFVDNSSLSITFMIRLNNSNNK